MKQALIGNRCQQQMFQRLTKHLQAEVWPPRTSIKAATSGDAIQRAAVGSHAQAFSAALLQIVPGNFIQPLPGNLLVIGGSARHSAGVLREHRS